MTRIIRLVLVVAAADAFGVLSYHRRYATSLTRGKIFLSEGSSSESGDLPKLNKEQMEQKVGNLVADDEWMGLTMELTELVRCAIIEDVKKNAREFTGKEEYKVGDFSKELDSRVKEQVAMLRGKEECKVVEGVASSLFTVLCSLWLGINFR